ncbi:MAG: hypothetical protein JRI55_35905 [Deltaproteobacteria bacterium]|nr:hypothetical protein [Deltaproteobacteria bacterium]
MTAVSDTPFAVGSDETLFVNIARLRGMKEPDALLELAVEQEGNVFMGVMLEPAEVVHLLRRLDEGAAEAVAYVLGARMWKEGG